MHQRGLQHDQISKGKEELFQSAARRRFLEIIEELKLIDIPLNGGAFTWCGGLNDQSMSRLDRFLVLEKWENHFLWASAVCLAEAGLYSFTHSVR